LSQLSPKEHLGESESQPDLTAKSTCLQHPYLSYAQRDDDQLKISVYQNCLPVPSRKICAYDTRLPTSSRWLEHSLWGIAWDIHPFLAPEHHSNNN